MLSLAALLLCCTTAQSGGIQFKAKLDSATLLMGKVTALHLDITQDAGLTGVFPIDRMDTLNAFVEIAARPAADTVDLGNNRIEIKRDLIIQAFDSGLYTIRPIAYVVNGDTAFCNPVTLKVVPVNVDSLSDIHPLAPPIQLPFRLADRLPAHWWVWLLVLLLLAAALYYYRRYYRHGKVNPLKHEKKRLPPYEEAIINLQNLKSKNLWQRGQDKEYFTGLTDILRVYIDRRFHVNAVEMTSQEIIRTLKDHAETRAVNEQLSMILEVADFVKFANAHPLADDNEVAYQRALNFVEATKPVETETEPDKPGKEGAAS